MTSRRISVGIDAREVHHYYGIAQVMRQVIPRLAAGGCRVVLFVDQPPSAEFQGWPVDWEILPPAAWTGSGLWRLGWGMRRNRLDLYHLMGDLRSMAAPFPFYRVPYVVTLYDCYHADYWSHSGPAWWFRRWCWREVRGRAWFVAISEFSRQELLARFPELAPRSRVNYLGADPGPPLVLPAGAVPSRYFLSVGADERKNLDMVLEAWAASRYQGEWVVVGEAGDRRAELERRARELGREGRIRWLGKVPGSLRPWLEGCDFLVHVSRHEGFGLPGVEAGALGIPVIASRAGALPEVLGESALLVPPRDVPALRDALERLGSDPSLRSRLGEAGRENSRRFNWDGTAERYLGLYEELLK